MSLARRSRSVVLLVALVALSAGQWATAAEESTNEQVARTATRGTVLVTTLQGGRWLPSGTAWLVDADRKLFVTCYHVVGNADQVQVIFPKYRHGKVVSDARNYGA
jgi:hypothetical protein